MRINEVDREVTQQELDALEKVLDRVFAQLGIDVEFTRHFLDRVNDERNLKQITIQELAQLFKKEFVKWGKPIARLGPDAEAVMKDLASNINIPFALNWNKGSGMLELVAKTVMRKRNFRTPNKEFPVESYTLTEKQLQRIDESFITEQAAFNLGGLDPAAFQQRYGVTPRQAANAFNNIRALNPSYNNPRFSAALNQYMLNNPGAMQAANDNFGPRGQPGQGTRLNPGALARGVAGRLLGAIGLILTPSAAGEGEDLLTAQIRQTQEFEDFLLRTDPQAYIELMNDHADRMSDQERQGGFDPRQTQRYRDAEDAVRMLSRDQQVQQLPQITPRAPEVDPTSPEAPPTPANDPDRPPIRVVPGTEPTPTPRPRPAQPTIPAPDTTPTRPATTPRPDVSPDAPELPTIPAPDTTPTRPTRPETTPRPDVSPPVPAPVTDTPPISIPEPITVPSPGLASPPPPPSGTNNPPRRPRRPRRGNGGTSDYDDPLQRWQRKYGDNF